MLRCIFKLVRRFMRASFHDGGRCSDSSEGGCACAAINDTVAGVCST